MKTEQVDRLKMGTRVWRFVENGKRLELCRATYIGRRGSWREYHGQGTRWKENGVHWYPKIVGALHDYLDRLAWRHTTRAAVGNELSLMVIAVALAADVEQRN